MSQEIAVIASVEARPEHVADVEAVIEPCIAATRREQGCLLYTVHAESARPGRFVFIERWDSEAALDAHKNTPHFNAMVQGLDGLTTGPLDVAVLVELDKSRA